MPGIPQVTQGKPRTFVPAVGELITGGQLVEGRAGGRIGVCAAGSVRCLGVAVTDAMAPESFVDTPVMVSGRPVLNASILAQSVAVAANGIEVPVTYSAAAAFGDTLIAAALGQVAPAGATPDARTIVGRCTEPNGVTGAGQVGLMRTAG